MLNKIIFFIVAQVFFIYIGYQSLSIIAATIQPI